MRVSSWLGAEVLAENIPVAGGVFTESDDQEIPERVELTVPVSAAGAWWDPGTDTLHPLARHGQRLYVVVDVANPRGDSWEMPLGWFGIQSWKIADDESTVSVVATGLLQLVADDTFARPEAPKAGGTLASEFRRLMSGGLPVDISTSLLDRACPGGFTWDEDRLAALYDIADAWPARIATNPDGTVMVLPPLGSTHESVLTLRDGEDGVLMSAPRDDTREGVYTAVVASSSADSAASTPVSAEYQTTTGAYATDAYGVVRRRYSSPLLGSAAACLAAARTIAEDSQRQGRVLTVTMPPDPRIQRGDAITLVWGGVNYRGWVQSVRLPLTVSGGAGVLTVGVPL